MIRASEISMVVGLGGRIDWSGSGSNYGWSLGNRPGLHGVFFVGRFLTGVANEAR